MACGVGWGAAQSGPGGLRVAGARSGGEKAAGADHVVRQRMPEPDRLGLLKAADEEAQQATVAALGVGALGGGGAPLVDRLGRLAAHAPAPSGNARPVTLQRRMRVAPGIARLRHRREHRDTRGGQRLDVGEAASASMSASLTKPPSARCSPGRCP